MNKNDTAALDEIVRRFKINEQETVELNFKLGDLFNSIRGSNGISAGETSRQLERQSGIHRNLFENYGRIARRLPQSDRPSQVPWGVIKFLFVDNNPRSFGVTEEIYQKAAIKALKDVESRSLTLAELRVSEDSWTTLAEKIIHSHLEK